MDAIFLPFLFAQKREEREKENSPFPRVFIDSFFSRLLTRTFNFPTGYQLTEKRSHENQGSVGAKNDGNKILMHFGTGEPNCFLTLDFPEEKSSLHRCLNSD